MMRARHRQRQIGARRDIITLFRTPSRGRRRAFSDEHFRALMMVAGRFHRYFQPEVRRRAGQPRVDGKSAADTHQLPPRRHGLNGEKYAAPHFIYCCLSLLASAKTSSDSRLDAARGSSGPRFHEASRICLRADGRSFRIAALTRMMTLYATARAVGHFASHAQFISCDAS